MSTDTMSAREPGLPIGADIIAALMWGPKTVRELIEFTGASKGATGRWLKVYETAGVIYRMGREAAPLLPDGRRQSGCRPIIYAMQPKPYENPNAPGTTSRVWSS